MLCHSVTTLDLTAHSEVLQGPMQFYLYSIAVCQFSSEDTQNAKNNANATNNNNNAFHSILIQITLSTDNPNDWIGGVFHSVQA